MQTQASKYWRSCCTAATVSLILFSGCEKKDEEKHSVNEDEIKKISETMGHYVIENLNAQSLTLDTESFIKGIEGAKAGQEPPLSKQKFLELLANYRKKAFEMKSSENLKMAEDYLGDNSNSPNIVVLEKGKLHYQRLKPGNGETVSETSTPLIQYEGKLIDGQVFDSTGKRGKPAELPLKSTIPGFRKGIVGMKEGEKRRLFIHPDLGYGENSRLPPNALLIFDVEVIKADAAKKEAKAPQKETSMSWLKRWAVPN
ncbi:macrophage infectivity potentiator [Waddlia chondrophila 2032/99]|uniref:Peptidyl-prolyl cis-trans isomerase n=1 Tax=Waddlia chondrophila 2032/99 TaxID=765953 RepID=F8LF41_9BACT|nr:macrophage infectivity potentiator [Waddlia chondrophila 2032/99]